MPDSYKDFTREPSKPHQCMYCFEDTGVRCRSTAMHNEYMCYHHRSDDIPTVIENDPFVIAALDDHDDIQRALADVAGRLACNRMDFKRATLLLQNLQIASANLIARNQLREKAGHALSSLAPPAPPAAPVCDPPAQTESVAAPQPITLPSIQAVAAATQSSGAPCLASQTCDLATRNEPSQPGSPAHSLSRHLHPAHPSPVENSCNRVPPHESQSAPDRTHRNKPPRHPISIPTRHCLGTIDAIGVNRC